MTLVEDCSPYYMRFHFESITDITNICNEALASDTFDNAKWLKLNRERSGKILSLLPFSRELNLNVNRLLMFKTPPHWSSDIHKDSIDHRVSFNITLKILDDACITSWWSDEDMLKFKQSVLDTPLMKSRILCDVDTTNINPIKTMTAVQGEFILFNTDIYHDWDNSNSDNERIVLTMRNANPANFYFDDAKQILLKYV